MSVFVNCSKVSTLIGCSRANLSKMWKIERDDPGHYGFFSENGKIDISSPIFIDRYGDHLAEWEELKSTKSKPESKPKTESKTKPKPKPEAEPEPETEPKKKPGRPKGSKNKPKPKSEPKKQRTHRQQVQDKIKADRETAKFLTNEDDEVKELQKKSIIAKYQKTILDKEKAEMELRKARADLAEIQTIGSICIGYLVALNQELLDQPRSFIDELTSGIKAGKSKTDLTDIARKPAMIAIAEAQEFIKKEIARYKRDIKSENK